MHYRYIRDEDCIASGTMQTQIYVSVLKFTKKFYSKDMVI